MVSLSPLIVDAYVAFVHDRVAGCDTSTVQEDEIPDERMEVREGELFIVCDAPEPIGTVEFHVPKGEWAWNQAN